MLDSYECFLGKKYQDLLKEASFLTLIQGNVPEIVDEDLEDFYIISDSNQVECIFNKKTQTLQAILFKKNSKGCFPKGLNCHMNADEVRNILGTPVESLPERKVPVLGTVPPFDKFERSVEVTYSVESGLVEEVRFGL